MAHESQQSWVFSLEGKLDSLPEDLVQGFRSDGFAVFPDAMNSATVQELNFRLEEILRGRYNRGSNPDKSPRLLRNEYHGENKDLPRQRGQALGPLGFSGNLENVKVLQVINVHKADKSFRKFAASPSLGKLVAQLAGWKNGARLAQDQVWAKPPHAPPLVFHRDSPYFMFTPSDVVTVWVALDDMNHEIGPLEYVRGSHKWGDGRVGSSNVFFGNDRGESLLQSAAERAGVSTPEIVSMAGLKAGGISIHDGRTWHGSGKNNSRNRPRRGFGVHFVPAEARFTVEATKSSLWKSYVDGCSDPLTVELDDEDFPVVWTPDLDGPI